MSKVGREFFSGLTFWLHGWRHLFHHRKLLPLAVLPFLIVVLAATGLGYFVLGNVAAWAHTILDWLSLSGRAQGLLYYPLLISAVLVVVVLGTYLAYVAQALVAIPFNALLVERTLEQIEKKRKRPWSMREWMAHSLNMLRIGLIKSVIFLLFGVILFVCSFMPGLNLLAFAGALLLVAYDCIDYSFEALGFGLRQRVRYVLREWAQWTGMATALALTLAIPGLTLLLIPGAVVGAALIIKPESLNP